MLRARFLGLSSAFLIILIAFSVLGPWDFLGTKDKLKLMDAFLYEDQVVSLSGRIYNKEIKNDKVIYYLKDVTLEADKKRFFKTSIILYLDSDDIPTYSKINIVGRVRLFSTARNDGAFDVKKYYNSMGIVCGVKPSSKPEVETGFFYRGDHLYRIKKSIFEVYARELPGEEAGFLASVVLGERSGLDGELRSILQRAGVAHVLAVSGLHISFLCRGLYGFLRKRGISFGGAGALSGSLAFAYLLMTGASISSRRAVGMFIIYLLSEVLGESYDMVTAMALICDLILIKNPLYIINSGFIFSFGATLGVAFVANPLCKSFEGYVSERMEERIPRLGLAAGYKKTRGDKLLEKILGSLIFSYSLNLACLPLVAFMYYEIPLYSLIVNSILLPLLPILIGLGLLGGGLGLAWASLGGIILKPCHYIIFFFEMTGAFFSRLPFSRLVVGMPGVLKMLLFWSFILLCLYVLPILIKHLAYKRGAFSGKPLTLRLLRLQLCALLSLSLIFMLPKPLSFEIDVLDVGQGDGIFISDGRWGSYFIDGGSTSEKELYKYTIEPFLKSKGISHIDYWFLTHPDEDHTSGIREAMEENYRIKNIVVSKALLDDPGFTQLFVMARARGINIIGMGRGDFIKNKNFSLTCLYGGEGKSFQAEANGKSLCILLKMDRLNSESPYFTGFFGGDIGTEEEKYLLREGLIRKVDFLKVSHHGSKGSSSEAFLGAIEPRVSVISCARENVYGHPAKETVFRIENSGSKVYYTMENGRIKINQEGINKYIP